MCEHVWACEEHVGEYVPAMRAATRAMDERFISAVLLLRTQREREREREARTDKTPQIFTRTRQCTYT